MSDNESYMDTYIMNILPYSCCHQGLINAQIREVPESFTN